MNNPLKQVVLRCWWRYPTSEPSLVSMFLFPSIVVLSGITTRKKKEALRV
jgi:hypothetical protein